MTETFSGADAVGNAAVAAPWCSNTQNVSLVGGVAKSLSFPADCDFCLLSFPKPFWAVYGGATAAVPTDDVAAGSGAVYCPAARKRVSLKASGAISLISETDQIGSVEWYSSRFQG